MTSNGDPKRDGSDELEARLAKDRSDLRKLLGMAAFLVVAMSLLFGASDMIKIMNGQEVSRNAASNCRTDSHTDRCESRVNSARSITTAEDAVRIGLWQTVLNVAGITGLAATIIYARRAWLAARDSADADNKTLQATREALKQSERVSQAELRPWVNISIKTVKVLIADHESGYANIQFELSNVGNSPATGVAINGEGVTHDEPYALSVADRLIREDRDAKIEHGGMPTIGISIFPGETAPLGRAYEVHKRGHMALVAGYVEYLSDITGQVHYTPWAYEIRYFGPQGDEVEAEAIKFFLTTSPT